MAVPKRRQTRTRRDKRRTHHKAEMPTWTNCSHCGEAMRSHHICQNCGFYKGKKYLKIKAEL